MKGIHSWDEGSLCGKQLSSDTVSSLGDQRRFNYALQPMSEEVFLRLITADQPDAPPYFTYDAILNTREHATLTKNLKEILHPVELDELIRLGDDGAQILDVRDAAEYALSTILGPESGIRGPNGLTLDRQQRLTICEQTGRRVSRRDESGSLSVLAEKFGGKKLNSPNDCVYRSDGTLYFTDPPFGLPARDQDPAKELPFSGIYRLWNGDLQLLSTHLKRPNGLAFSPDEKYLYALTPNLNQKCGYDSTSL